ncbi:MAG TPA: single-stranded-DNA-specific exonuclease RecJ [Gemmataceae bacterium]|nr:single-stranded-DNA-specific exonuclease RecJ [Gemmataceae bacterium]
MDTVAKIWQLLPHDRSAMEQLGKTLRVPPVVAQLLLNRGIVEAEQARRFLDAPMKGLHPPHLLPGVTQAAERLLDAVRQQKRICVYGDYDVDGTAGTAILWQMFHLLGGQADFYVPHRLEEGYGLNGDALRQIAQTGAAVVVTVDCGIGSVAEAEEANRLGLELIVTDHHEMKETLPAAAVLVHPRLPGSAYPFGGLSGAGVAFKLAWALAQRACGSERVTPRYREFLLNSLVLAALGLVADVVPLHDENRIFVRHGLARLKTAPTPGLKALLDATALSDKAQLCAEDISFRLAPRLNAVGRLGSARLVIELLTTSSSQRAVDLVRFLEGQNEQRQQYERKILARAREMVAAHDLNGTPAIILADPEWHPGVVGIVASRLVDLYARPVLLIGLRQERGEACAIGQGSGRSVPGFPLHKALHACGEHLLSHGGHAAAAGFKIEPHAIDLFREHFCAYAAQHFQTGPPAPRLVIDAEVPLSALTPGLVKDLDRLEPYGAENRRPLFLAAGLQVDGQPKKVGASERHLSFRVRQHGRTLRAIAFNMAERAEELMASGGTCSLVFSPDLNEWQGFRRVDLKIVDLQAGPEARLG